MSLAVTIPASVSIDVDATAAFMGILFILLYFILEPLIMKPYLRAREMRRDAVDGAREEARESEALAEARMMEFEEEMKTARREAADTREGIRLQGASAQRELVDAAHTELQGKLAEERAVLAKQVEAAQRELQGRAAALSEAMVAKILPRVG